MRKSSPLMMSLFFSGTIDFSNGYLIRHYMGALDFAKFRAGAREFPIFLIMTNTLSNVLSGKIAEFHKEDKLSEGLDLLKQKTSTLIKYLFPVAILLLCISKYIFRLLYFKQVQFVEGYHVFNILLLLLVSRFLYPQTVLQGLHKTRFLAYTSVIEFGCIFILAWALVIPFGIYGVAFATVFGFYIEKAMLLYFCKREGVAAPSYLPVKQWATYSLLLWAVFITVFFVS